MDLGFFGFTTFKQKIPQGDTRSGQLKFGAGLLDVIRPADAGDSMERKAA
jgi:hypothetical protein